MKPPSPTRTVILPSSPAFPGGCFLTVDASYLEPPTTQEEDDDATYPLERDLGPEHDFAPHAPLPRLSWQDEQGNREDWLTQPIGAQIRDHAWVIPEWHVTVDASTMHALDDTPHRRRFNAFMEHRGNAEAIAYYHDALAQRWTRIHNDHPRAPWKLGTSLVILQKCLWLPIPLSLMLSPLHTTRQGRLVAVHNEAVLTHAPIPEMRHDRAKGTQSLMDGAWQRLYGRQRHPPANPQKARHTTPDGDVWLISFSDAFDTKPL